MEQVNMKDPRVGLAARRLQQKFGRMPTMQEIAVELSVNGSAYPVQPTPADQPGMVPGYGKPAIGERKAPEGSAEQRAEQRGKAKQGKTDGLTPEQKRRFGIK